MKRHASLFRQRYRHFFAGYRLHDRGNHRNIHRDRRFFLTFSVFDQGGSSDSRCSGYIPPKNSRYEKIFAECTGMVQNNKMPFFPPKSFLFTTNDIKISYCKNTCTRLRSPLKLLPARDFPPPVSEFQEPMPPFTLQLQLFQIFLQRQILLINIRSRGETYITNIPRFVRITRDIRLTFRKAQNKTRAMRVFRNPSTRLCIGKIGENSVIDFRREIDPPPVRFDVRSLPDGLLVLFASSSPSRHNCPRESAGTHKNGTPSS